MSKKSQDLTIAKGFQYCENTSFIDPEIAFNQILCGKKQFKYSSVQIIEKDNTVKLIEHFLLCPNCGQRTPAYQHYIQNYTPKKCLSKKEAFIYANEVMSFFETTQRVIPLYTPISQNESVKCVHCGATGKCNDQKVSVTLKFHRKKLSITYPLTNIGDIIRLNWTEPDLIITELPLSETVTFNFKKGTTHLSLRNQSGKLLAAKDISNGIDITFFNSPLIALLSENIYAKRATRKFFARIWDKNLPFGEKELDIHKFALATAFIGYDDLEFYTHIPCNECDVTFNKSYNNIKRRMRYADNLISIHAQSSIPNMKSVKKILFRNPYLFFFLDEIEKLWETSGKEPNFFCAVINNDKAYSILSFLHDHPLAFLLYNDICKKGLHTSFKEVLLSSPREVNEYAVSYAAMSEAKKAKVRSELLATSCKALKSEYDTMPYFYRIPDRNTLKLIPTQTVNEYVFTTLKTVNDYIIAGKQLNNCLGKEEFNSPVVGVIKNGKYVAALQVIPAKKIVVQAFIENNEEIEDDKDIYAAFNKWCKNNDYRFDDDESYPF